MNVVCVGDCGVDHYLPQNLRLAGGITLNFALRARHCFASDDRIQIVAPLGSDAAAGIVARRVAGAGIDCHFVQVAGTTPVQYIEIDAAGERYFPRYEEGVLRNFAVNAEIAARISSADLLVTPVFAQNRAMFSAVMGVAKPAMTAVDFSDFADDPDFALLNEHVERVAVGFFGLQQDQGILIDGLRQVARASDALIVITLGSAGSCAFDGDEVFECAPLPVERIVDTTGAGDAFAAGFLSEYCQSAGTAAALRRGAAMAAEAVQQAGGN
jgi:sugar/nucleoside kinase (ribokinase family)